MSTYRYDVRWTQRRSKKQLLPRLIVAASRQDALFALANALKENEPFPGSLPKRVGVTYVSATKGPKRVEWLKQ